MGSPPSGENKRGGDTSGILHHEHRKCTRCYPLLTVKWLVTSHLPLGAGIVELDERNIVFHAASAAPFGSQGYHLPPEGGDYIRSKLFKEERNT